MTKQERVDNANQFIQAVAGCGRKFFAGKGRVARLELDKRGRVWFVDSYTGKRIYTHYKGDWRGFSGGGTLRGLVQWLSYYVMTGDTISPVILGPFPQFLCDGDPWGYGDDMALVRRKAAELGIIPALTGEAAQ